MQDGDFSNNVAGNLDLINWLVNQNFTDVDNGDGVGTNFTDAEIQFAIWGITDNDSTVTAGTDATQENVDQLIALAQENGNDFEAGEGDLVSFILNPDEDQAQAESDDHDQAFIVFARFEDFDCIC